MKQFHKRQKTLLSSVAILLFVVPSLQAATFVTTGVYDENTVSANVVDTTAPASNVSLATFTSNVSTAFSAGLGGVVDFDSPNGVPGGTLGSIPNFTISYGASQSNTLTITSGNASGFNTNNNNTGNGLTGPLSGANYLGASVNFAGQSLIFSVPLESFGITVLSKNATQTITPTVYFADTTSITLASFNIANLGTDTFIGYSSPGNLITRLDIVPSNGNGFARLDDFGFVVGVPEPSSMALGLMGGVGMLGLLRRRHA